MNHKRERERLAFEATKKRMTSHWDMDYLPRGELLEYYRDNPPPAPPERMSLGAPQPEFTGKAERLLWTGLGLLVIGLGLLGVLAWLLKN